jgi:3D (Asp-Asp-Asp) domain-containing protein
MKARIKVIGIAAAVCMMIAACMDTTNDIPTIKGEIRETTKEIELCKTTQKAVETTKSAVKKTEVKTESKKDTKAETKKKKNKIKPSSDAYKVRCTCYIPTGNPTASGIYPHEGVIATNRQHLGESAMLFTLDGEFIGYFDSMDTGGHVGLKNGTRIDVYRDTLDRAYDWVATYGDYVLIEWTGVTE